MCVCGGGGGGGVRQGGSRALLIMEGHSPAVSDHPPRVPSAATRDGG